MQSCWRIFLLVINKVIVIFAQDFFPNQITLLGRPDSPLLNLRWRANGTDVALELEGRTRGWMAIGRSPDGRMDKSDILFTWVDPTGAIYAQDRFIIADENTLTVNLTLDKVQDWKLLNGRQNATHTTIRAMRKLTTSDPSDYSLADTFNLIYSMGDNPPDRNTGEIKMHSARGTRQFSGFKLFVNGPVNNPSSESASSVPRIQSGGNQAVLPFGSSNNQLGSAPSVINLGTSTSGSGLGTSNTEADATTEAIPDQPFFGTTEDGASTADSVMSSTTESDLVRPVIASGMTTHRGPKGASFGTGGSSFQNTQNIPAGSQFGTQSNQRPNINAGMPQPVPNAGSIMNGPSRGQSSNAFGASGLSVSSSQSASGHGVSVDGSSSISGSNQNGRTQGSGGGVSWSGTQNRGNEVPTTSNGDDNAEGPKNLLSVQSHGSNITANFFGIPISWSSSTGLQGGADTTKMEGQETRTQNVSSTSKNVTDQVVNVLETIWSLIGQLIGSPPTNFNKRS